jgi:hypothetical protein
MADDSKDLGKKGLGKSDYWLAAALVVAGLVTSGLSLAEIKAQGRQQVAQNTQPLQGTPAPDSNNSAPAEAKPGGTRPTTPAPEPARPDQQAQQEGAKPALPPAPAEKVAPAMKNK